MKSKFNITAILVVVVVFVCAAAIEPVDKTTEFKNLQVLPKNISETDLQRIMENECSKGLGVSCDYCHTKVVGSDELDYVSDAKGEKEAARTMMRMTMEINKKYFSMERPMIGDSLMSVTCKSCHHGEPYPPK
jgi:hypothetical protein